MQIFKIIASYNYIGMLLAIAALAVFARYKSYDENTGKNHKKIKIAAVVAFVAGALFMLSPLVVKIAGA